MGSHLLTINSVTHHNIIMACVRWLSGGNQEDEAEDYAYFKWEFKPREQELEVKEVEDVKTCFESNNKQTEFENIHSWLEKHNSEHNFTNEEELHYACIDVTNFETSDFNYTKNPRIPRSFVAFKKQRLDFHESEESSEASYSSETKVESFDTSDEEEEASYSSQIRQKSNALFIKCV